MELLSTAVRPTGPMGRKAIRRQEPDNTETVERLKAEDPNKSFEVCIACGNWALIWPDDVYSGMHPMGCFDTARGQRLLADRRRAEKKTGSTDSFFN